MSLWNVAMWFNIVNSWETFWVDGRVWDTLIPTPISWEQLVWEKWFYHTSVPGHTVWDKLIPTPISWEQLCRVRKMMLPHICARPHCVGYTDGNTNLGSNLECEKNDVTTRLCQATLQASHTPMLQALSSCHNGVQLSVQRRGGLAATVPRIDKN